jgi:ribosomal-protein-alanine N-acetyltransferase
MSKEVVLRDYRPADLETMFQLDEICFSEEFRFNRRSMRAFAEDSSALVYIAETTGGELAGFVIVHLERIASRLRGYVVTLDVAPGYRRIGIAARLMDEVERRAECAGASQMELHVFSKNDSAFQFYEQRGYQRVGARLGFYGPGLDGWVYRKVLR